MQRYKHFFMQKDSMSCGCCVVNVILAKYKKQGVIFSVDPEKGTPPRRITTELRDRGLEARPKKTKINYLTQVHWWILWYPPRGRKKRRGDHYTVFVGVAKNKGRYLIYDSAKEEPCWLTASELKNKWYGAKKDGWVIEVKKPDGKG